MGAATVTSTSKPERVRLHITPFNADLFDRIIPPSLQSSASNISFHTVQTSPDRGFGYVELTAMEADKLKKKFNGTTLKGMKVRMEDAKPEKKRKAEAEDVDEKDLEREARKKAKKVKAKREEGVLPGHELEEGRHVKRGWKEHGQGRKDSKKVKKSEKEGIAKSDSVSAKKLLFKTSVPPNALPVESKQKSKSTDKEKPDKKEKNKEKKNKGKKNKEEVVVEEGKKSKKLNAVGAQDGKKRAASVYEDGVGWVDANGGLIEAEPESRKRKRRLPSSVEETSQSAQQPVAEVPHEDDPQDLMSDDEVSSVVSDSTEESEAEVEEIEMADADNDDHEANIAELSIKPPPQAGADATITEASEPSISEPRKEIHPLEALFKRPTSKQESASKPKPSPINTAFNFFNSDDAVEEEETDAVPGLPPQTPHTKQDMEWRSIRSAAPTPDTAAIGRKFSFPFANGGGLGLDVDEEDDDDDEDGSSEIDAEEGGHAVKGSAAKDPVVSAIAAPSATVIEGEKEESEYRKWFFDHRGDLNRGWKKRRREERKLQRQRENRRLSRRVL